MDLITPFRATENNGRLSHCEVLLAFTRTLLILPAKSAGVSKSPGPSRAGFANRKSCPGLYWDWAGCLAFGDLLAIHQESHFAVGTERGLDLEMSVSKRLFGRDRRQFAHFADGEREFSFGQIECVTLGGAALGDDDAGWAGRVDLRGNVQRFAGDRGRFGAGEGVT